MADNFFDQFDDSAPLTRDAGNTESAAAPVLTPSKAESVLGSPMEIQSWLRPTATPKTSEKKPNYFDQFDASTPWYKDVAWQIPQGVNEGLSDFVNIFNLPRWYTKTANLLGADIPDYPRFDLAERFNPGGEYAKAVNPESTERPPETMAGEFARSMGRAVGSSAIPEATLLSKGQQLAKLAPTTTLRQTGKDIGTFYTEKPGLATSVAAGSTAASGAGSEAAKEAGFGPGMQIAAGAVTPMLPAGVVLAAPRAARALGQLTDTTGFGKPTFARLDANARAVLRKIGISASAEDEPYAGALPSTPVKPGAEAASDQMLANYLMRANKTPDDLEKALDLAAEARVYNSSGVAQDALGLVDLDPSMQRLLGSITRSNLEASNKAADFFYARQTGLTPAAGLPAEANIPTRPLLGQPLKGKDAQEIYGHTFDTQPQNVVPTGAYARMRDALKRAFLISDSDFHGHAANANRTDQAIIDAAEAEAKPAYDAVREAAKGVDLSPTITPILQRWQAKADALADGHPARRAIERAITFFSNKNGAVKDFTGFDQGKQLLDDEITKAFKGDDIYIGKYILRQMKQELLKGADVEPGAIPEGIPGVNYYQTRLPGVDDITTNGLGQKYMDARAKFSSRQMSRRALQAGREAPSQDPDSAKAAYNDIDEDIEKKLFRLGIVGDYEKSMGRRGPTADATKWFDNHNTMELLAHVIPRSGKTGAQFANRPERLGRYIGAERAQMRSQRKVQEGSPTAERAADDEALEGMHQLTDQISGQMHSAATGSVSALGLVTKGIKAVLNKAFGYRADTSAAVARSLLSADPKLRAATIARVRLRMGADRFAYFQQLLEKQVAQATAARGVTATAPNLDEEPPKAFGGAVLPGARTLAVAQKYQR